MPRRAAREEEEEEEERAPPPRRSKKPLPPPSEYDEEVEEARPPRRGKGAGKPRPPPTPEPEEEEEEEPQPEKQGSAFERWHDGLSPGGKMLYTMFTSAWVLIVLTGVGGIIYYALERNTALNLNANYYSFMLQLNETLACVGSVTGACADLNPGNGTSMYDDLISNYMADPTTLRDLWAPNSNTLYLFAFTIVSTIGYGTFAPKTSGGQIFTIFYALIAIPVGGVALGKVAGTLLEMGEWVLYSLLSGRIRRAYAEANKSGDGILDYDDARLACQKAQGHEIDAKDFVAAVKEFDAFESHEISHGSFAAIYLKVDKEEMQELRATDRAKVCSLLVVGWLALGMFYFSKAEGWTYVESMYFGVVTLTTIGFGDYIPTTPAGDAFHFLFCILGLGLVATLLGALSALAAGGGGEEEEEEEGGAEKKGVDGQKKGEEPVAGAKGRRSSTASLPKSGLAGQAMMAEGARSRHEVSKSAAKPRRPTAENSGSLTPPRRSRPRPPPEPVAAPPPPPPPAPFGIPGIPDPFGIMSWGKPPAPPPPVAAPEPRRRPPPPRRRDEEEEEAPRRSSKARGRMATDDM